MKTHKRVTAFIQDDEEILSRQGRLVEDGDLVAIDRVFRIFHIQYEVDDIPAGTRLYSLTAAMRDRYISDNLLTRKELAEHISPYLGKKSTITPGEFKKLLTGKISQIHKKTPGGEILLGYELTIKGEKKQSIFRFPKFGRKKAAKAD